MDRRYLEETWMRHGGGDTATLDALLGRYAEPHRRYHTVAHLEAVWRALDERSLEGLDADAIYLAAAYHDAIYDPKASDNEARSADLAAADLRRLGHDQTRIALVCALVVDTQTHIPTSPESAELSDADMAMLAAPRETYLRDAAAIRAEYAVFDDEVWAAGRIAFLEHTLERPIFYVHPEREPLARANIEFELASLRDG
jgi:predicted metal-dependent HD superfamily phosphohydrolase